MLGIIFGCYICYYIITGGCISIRMVLLTVRPKYRSENNLSILGGCCSDCAGWGKRSLLGKQCLRAVSLHWIWQEKINRTSLWRKEARAADGDDDKKAGKLLNTPLRVSYNQSHPAIEWLAHSIEKYHISKFWHKHVSLLTVDQLDDHSLWCSSSLTPSLMWCISLMVYDI